MRIHDLGADKRFFPAFAVAVLFQICDVRTNFLRHDARLRDAGLSVRTHGVDGRPQIIQSKIDKRFRHLLRQQRRIRRNLHLMTNIRFLDFANHARNPLVQERLACRIELDEFNLLPLTAAKILHVLHQLVKKFIRHIAEGTAVFCILRCALPAHKALEIADIRRLDTNAQRHVERHDIPQRQPVFPVCLGKRHYFIAHYDSPKIYGAPGFIHRNLPRPFYARYRDKSA